MDCGTKYIKMCKQAVEIQEQWEDEYLSIGDETDFGIITSLEEYYDDNTWRVGTDEGFQDTKDLIWRPKQDQLQKMVINFDIGYQNSGILFGLMRFAERHKYEESSFEQLWLAYVMCQKYQKYWNNCTECWEKYKARVERAKE